MITSNSDNYLKCCVYDCRIDANNTLKQKITTDLFFFRTYNEKSFEKAETALLKRVAEHKAKKRKALCSVWSNCGFGKDYPQIGT